MREGWWETTLGEVVEIIIGRTPPRNDVRFWTTNLDRPFCTIADMTGQQVLPRREGVTESAEKAGRARRVPEGALLMSFKLTLGRVGFAQVDLFPNEAIAWLRPKRPDVADRYLALSLSTMDLQDHAGRAVKGRTLNRSSLKAIPILLPPLDEQRRIVDLITAVDEAINAATAVTVASDTAYAALLDEMNARSCTPQPLAQLVEWARAGGTPSRSRSDFYDGTIPWLKSGEVADGAFNTEERISHTALVESSAWLVPSGSVLVAMYGATAGKIGYTAADLATNQAVLALSGKPEVVHNRWLFHWLCSQREELKHSATGAAQPNLSKDRVLERSVPLLELNEQVAWAGLLDAQLDSGVAASRVTSALAPVRVALLADLLSGDHEIPSSYDEVIG